MKFLYCCTNCARTVLFIDLKLPVFTRCHNIACKSTLGSHVLQLLAIRYVKLRKVFDCGPTSSIIRDISDVEKDSAVFVSKRSIIKRADFVQAGNINAAADQHLEFCYSQSL